MAELVYPVYTNRYLDLLSVDCTQHCSGIVPPQQLSKAFWAGSGTPVTGNAKAPTVLDVTVLNMEGGLVKADKAGLSGARID